VHFPWRYFGSLALSHVSGSSSLFTLRSPPGSPLSQYGQRDGRNVPILLRGDHLFDGGNFSRGELAGERFCADNVIGPLLRVAFLQRGDITQRDRRHVAT